jgi:mannitol/fructose-specific phosphotransferase system IIA component (Ntr-type)
MADVNKYINPELIITRLNVETKEQAIRRLVDRIFEKQPACFDERMTAADIYQQVINRENIQSTGVGGRIAFPHARIDRCRDLVLAIGLVEKGIDFGSRDGLPCNIICLMISPSQKPYIILQVMAALSSFFVKRANVDAFVAMSSASQIADTLKSLTLPVHKTVIAADIMLPVGDSVLPETPVQEVANIMHFNKLEVLPVVDKDMNLCGEISCLNIFTYGMPDFFRQLQTVSFVRYLDPFEKYFRLRKDLKVEDLYTRKITTIQKDVTLMEIIFEMTAKNKSHLYVVDGTRLVGVVDRFSVIHKILFF